MDADLLSQFMAAMEAQLRILDDLLDMEQKKTDVLLAGKPADLEVLVKGEQVLTWQLARAEEQRQTLQAQLASGLNLPPDPLSLQGIVGAAPPQYRERFEHLTARYQDVCAALEAQNTRNTALIKGALAYFDFATQVLRGPVGPGSAYAGPGPSRPEAGARDPRFLDNRT